MLRDDVGYIVQETSFRCYFHHGRYYDTFVGDSGGGGGGTCSTSTTAIHCRRHSTVLTGRSAGTRCWVGLEGRRPGRMEREMQIHLINKTYGTAKDRYRYLTSQYF